MPAPDIFDANRSNVLINGEPIAGVRAIEYRQERAQGEVFALGQAERVGVYHGQLRVRGRLQVASASAGMEALAGVPDAFQIVARLGGATTGRIVTFDDCFIHDKSLTLGTGGHAETVYDFTATRLREEEAPAT